MEREYRVERPKGQDHGFAAQTARRVAAQRKLAGLAKGINGHPYDIAAAFAAIGAVGAAVTLAAAFFSIG